MVFVFGLAVGSFLNTVIHRLVPGESFLLKRSYCPKCKHVLAWHDLIPVLSFLYLKGRCRYCSKKISWQYPLVEVATGFLFVLIANYELGIRNYELINFENIISSLFLILTSCFLIVIFVYDLKYYIIPDKIVYPAVAGAVLYRFFEIWNFGNWHFFGIGNLGFGILPSLFFLAIILLSMGQWMGMGDFKLAFLMGLFLGWPNILVALFFAFCFGAIIGIGLMIFGKKNLKSEVPFGPFLVTGTFFALFWGEIIISWYFNLL